MRLLPTRFVGARPLAPFVCLASAFAAAPASAQAPDVRAEVGLAARTDDPQESARLLRHAWLIAGLIEDDRERRSLQREVGDKLREVDREGVRVVRDVERMVKDLREAAASYTAKGWYETARSLLRAVDLVLPEAAEDGLQKIALLRAEAAPEQAAAGKAPEPGRNDALLKWFEGGYNPYGEEEFQVTDEAVASPKLEDASGKGWFSRHVFRGDGRLRLQIGMPGVVKGRAGIAFSQTDANEMFRYYLAELEHEQDVLNLVITRIENSESTHLALSKINWKCPKDLHYHEVELVLSGRCIVMQVDDHPTVATAPLLLPNEGAIGLYVSGNSEYKEPVLFRQLAVETLVPHSL